MVFWRVEFVYYVLVRWLVYESGTFLFPPLIVLICLCACTFVCTIAALCWLQYSILWYIYIRYTKYGLQYIYMYGVFFFILFNNFYLMFRPKGTFALFCVQYICALACCPRGKTLSSKYHTRTWYSSTKYPNTAANQSNPRAHAEGPLELWYSPWRKQMESTSAMQWPETHAHTAGFCPPERRDEISLHVLTARRE